MRKLVERQLDGESVHPSGGERRGRRVTVNLTESALSWLGSRGMVDARQIEAGERLRGDYERAAIAHSVTMRWDPSPRPASLALSEGSDPTIAQIDAKRRFDAAVAGVGPGLSDILWRVVCADERLADAERALGWPARAGKLVLRFALDRLANHYGLRQDSSAANPRGRARG